MCVTHVVWVLCKQTQYIVDYSSKQIEQDYVRKTLLVY